MNGIKENSFINPDMECINLESNNKIIIAVYRPPGGNKKLFMNKLVSMCNQNEKSYFIAGNFNLDVTSKEFDPILDKGIFQSCNKYTRVTNQSRSIIDNIFTTSKSTKCYLTPCSISDHFPIILETSTKKVSNKKVIEIKEINIETKENLKEDSVTVNGTTS